MAKQRRIQLVLSGEYSTALEAEREETGMTLTDIFKKYMMVGRKFRLRQKDGWRIFFERDGERIEVLI